MNFLIVLVDFIVSLWDVKNFLDFVVLENIICYIYLLLKSYVFEILNQFCQYFQEIVELRFFVFQLFDFIFFIVIGSIFLILDYFYQVVMLVMLIMG